MLTSVPDIKLYLQKLSNKAICEIYLLLNCNFIKWQIIAGTVQCVGRNDFFMGYVASMIDVCLYVMQNFQVWGIGFQYHT